MNIDISKFISSIESCDKSELAYALSSHLDTVQLAEVINRRSLEEIQDMASNMYFGDRLEIVSESFKRDDISDIASYILSVLDWQQRQELINLISNK